MTASATTHVGTTGHVVNQMPRRGTGLHDTSLIGNRQAEPFELEIKERAYEQARQRDLDLLKIAPRSQPDEKWAAVEDALEAVRRG